MNNQLAILKVARNFAMPFQVSDVKFFLDDSITGTEIFDVLDNGQFDKFKDGSAWRYEAKRMS